MTTVNGMLAGKQGTVWSITPGATGRGALDLMTEKNVSALPVLDRDRLVGIISERDFVRKVFEKLPAGQSVLVSDIMTRQVICVTLAHTTEECMALMIDKHIRHLPVVQDNRLVGMLSIRDLVSEVLSEKDFTIEQMRHYICGS